MLAKLVTDDVKRRNRMTGDNLDVDVRWGQGLARRPDQD